MLPQACQANREGGQLCAPGGPQRKVLEILHAEAPAHAPSATALHAPLRAQGHRIWPAAVRLTRGLADGEVWVVRRAHQMRHTSAHLDKDFRAGWSTCRARRPPRARPCACARAR